MASRVIPIKLIRSSMMIRRMQTRHGLLLPIDEKRGQIKPLKHIRTGMTILFFLISSQMEFFFASSLLKLVRGAVPCWKPGTSAPLPLQLTKRLGIQRAITHATKLKGVHCVVGSTSFRGNRETARVSPTGSRLPYV